MKLNFFGCVIIIVCVRVCVREKEREKLGDVDIDIRSGFICNAT